MQKYTAASFPDWGFISVDADRRLLLAAWRSSASGHGWAIWEYIDGVLTKTHECKRNYLNTSVDGVEMVHFYEEQLTDGEMQVIFDSHLTEEELERYLHDNALWRHEVF